MRKEKTIPEHLQPCAILTPAQGRIYKKNFYLSEMVRTYQIWQEKKIPPEEKEILSHYRQRLEELEAEEAQESNTLRLRVSGELLDTIRRAADAAKISSAGVVRRCVASIRNGREIEWRNSRVALTGKEVLTIPHCIYTGNKDTLRRYIYVRCMEVIAAQKRAAKDAFFPEEKEGVDYIVTAPEGE